MNQAAIFQLHWRFQPSLDVQKYPPAIRVLPYRPHQKAMVDTVKGSHDTLPTSRIFPPRLPSCGIATLCKGKRWSYSVPYTAEAFYICPLSFRMGAARLFPPRGRISIRMAKLFVPMAHPLPRPPSDQSPISSTHAK
jgi:hypothetical protein